MSDDRKTVIILGAGLFLLPLVFNWEGGSTQPVKRAVLYATVAALGFVWMRPAGGTRSPSRVAGLIPGCLYVLMGGCSVLWAVNPFSAFVESLQGFALLFVFVIAASELNTMHFHQLARYAAASGLIVAVIGICQYLGLAFLWIPSAGLPSGTFSFRNLTASYLIGSLPLALVAWQTDSHHTRRAIWLLSASAMLILLVYTRTRGAWAGLIIGSAISLFFLFRRGYRLPAFSILNSVKVGLVILAIVLMSSLSAYQPGNAPQKFDEVKSSAGTALASMVDIGADRGRRIFWGKTLEMIADYPILGVGLDNWEFHYPVYDLGTWNRGYAEPVRPHNDLLWIWSELGILGLAGFLGVILIAILGTLRGPRDPVHDAVSTGCLASFIALIGHGQFSFLREQPAVGLLMCLGLLGLALPHRQHLAVSSKKAVGGGIVIFALAALTVSIAHTRFETKFQKALGVYSLGDELSAERLADEAIAHGVFDHRALFLKGKIQQSAGRFAEAQETYRTALEYHPNYANTHHNLGGTLAAQGFVKAAIEAYRRSLDIRPTNVEARVNLATALISDGQVQGAQKEMAEAIRSGTRLPTAHGTMGAILLYQNQPEAAIRYLVQAVELSSDYVEAFNNLALAYEQAGQPRKAAEAYQNVVRLWKGDPGYRESIQDRIRQLTGDSL
jgi:O-antigen ligase/Tfp pilus assembly protein PilF